MVPIGGLNNYPLCFQHRDAAAEVGAVIMNAAALEWAVPAMKPANWLCDRWRGVRGRRVRARRPTMAWDSDLLRGEDACEDIET